MNKSELDEKNPFSSGTFAVEVLSQGTNAVTLGLRVATSMSVNLSKRVNEKE
jgi:hypothetical protein